jgi:hypothetical protein
VTFLTNATYVGEVLEILLLLVELGDHRSNFGTLGASKIFDTTIGHLKIPLETSNLIVLGVLPSQELVLGTVSLADHVSHLQVLILDLLLHLLHLVNSLLGRVGLELHSLELAQKIQMLLTQLRVKLGESLILGFPYVDLLCIREEIRKVI